jgi:hypothetical protein
MWFKFGFRSQLQLLPQLLATCVVVEFDQGGQLTLLSTLLGASSTRAPVLGRCTLHTVPLCHFGLQLLLLPRLLASWCCCQNYMALA